jgi:DNA-binding NtrC family response regulator
MTSQDGQREAEPGAQSRIAANFRQPAEWRAGPNQSLIVVQLDRDGPDARRFLDAAAAVFKGIGPEPVICRSLAEVGRRVTASEAACALIPVPSESLQSHVAGIESLATVAPALRRILIGSNELGRDPYLADFLLRGLIYDFVVLPRDRDLLIASVARAARLAHIEATTKRQNFDLAPGDAQMVGTSQTMRRVFENIRKLAPTQVPVLITGESGTGKELAARAIHDRSPVASGPFVAINCAGIPSTLIESELFGYEKGAFTGAAGRKIGRVETAHGGTLFLDEIGDMSLEVQAHLLRFLQEGKIQRLGGTTEIPVRARIIVATHVNLEKAVESNRFREDLYYRLRILTLELPPLHEREGDVELLANFFLAKFAADQGRCTLRLSKAASMAVRRYRWPGNVRELIGAMRRAAVMSSGPLVRPEDLGIPQITRPEKSPPPTLAEARARVELDVVRSALHYNANNVQQAAKMLGISRVALYRFIKKYDLGSSGTRIE